ncbi:MAG: glycosyltransferase [Alphaproteobacteria bacterium]|nr:MAG: glycosyltransferase [Alphaproteobacteria bacterium]
MQNLARKNYSEKPAACAVVQTRKSVSRQMAERFERRKLWRRSVAVAYVLVLTTYLAWRYTIINPESLFLSVMYYAADCIGLVLGITAIITSWNYKHRDPRPAPAGLSVDVFVPTYKEPLHIIRRTVIAAKAIHYPHGTFVLDDGKRDEVQALAEELGVRYLRRPENRNAKAGNLNYGLAHSTADFVMTFDADHIALPHALDVMLGFFDDEKVAMVQTPQDYYNTDAFQYINAGRTGGLWHDQSFFYNIVQSSGDAVNASSCVGTGVVYRRSALDGIGGIPVDTVTEDMHTSLKMHKAGYKTVFLNEPIAYGVAAADLPEYYKTRHRWAHGNMHAAVRENILFCKGLTPWQRFQYLSLELIYLEGWQQLMLFIIPILALALGLQPFKITILNVLIVFSFPFVSYLLLQEIGCGFTRYWANEIFAMARWPLHIIATAGLFCRKMAFSSSSKTIQGRVNWRLMAPQMVVAGASLFAVAAGIVNLKGDYSPGPLFQFLYQMVTTFSIPDIDMNAGLPLGYTIDLVAIAGFWALYGAVRAGFFARKVFRDARNSNDFFRFHIPVPVLLDAKGGYGCVSAVSEEWIAFTDYREGPRPAPESMMDMTIMMPAGPLPVKVAVETVKGREITGRLVFDSTERRDKLANGLYSVDWHREFLHRAAYFLTPSDVVVDCLRLRSPFRREYGPWRAALYKVAGKDTEQSFAIMAKIEEDPAFVSMIAFEDFPLGASISGIQFSEDKARAFNGIVTDHEPLSSLVEQGLDGASVRRYRVRYVAGMLH